MTAVLKLILDEQTNQQITTGQKLMTSISVELCSRGLFSNDNAACKTHSKEVLYCMMN